MFSITTSQNNIVLKPSAAGLVPGIPYFVRIQPTGNPNATFRLNVPTWSNPDYNYLKASWENAGRAWMAKFSNVRWSNGRWQIDQNWPNRDQIGHMSYYLEPALRGVLNMGLVCHNLELLDEMASFYVTYFTNFVSLGQIKQMHAGGDTSLLRNQGKDSDRSLPWIEKDGNTTRVEECTLCNSQFLHPAARLLRVIATMPESERTPAMKTFASEYGPLIVRDHLIRLLYDAQWQNYAGVSNAPNHLVDMWKAFRTKSARAKEAYKTTLQDRDLWLIGTAAEVLGANADDPNLVPLTPDEAQQLHAAVAAGVQFLQEKQTFYSDTRNFQGKVVGSTSYFNGEYDDHPDMAYSAYTGQDFPGNKSKSNTHGASWDVSHFLRVPVVMRSLYDTRKATGLNFPTYHDLELLDNQMVYKVFQGNFEQPLFNNFFDGSNGWYRVAYSNRGNFGYPPAQFCDAHGNTRPCLTEGAVQGWGLIAFASPDLARLEESLVKLAARSDPSSRAFADHYYYYNATSFSFTDGRGQPQYPILLFYVLSDAPERLPGCIDRTN